MSTTKCYYHRDKIAIATCERCHRPICLEDKRVYHKTHRYSDSRYETTRVYCTVCYGSQKEQDSAYAVIGGIIAIVVIIFGLLAFGSMASSMPTVNSNNYNNNMYVPSEFTMSGTTYYCNNNGICTPSTSTTPVASSSASSNPVFIILLITVFIILAIGAIIYVRSQTTEHVKEATSLKRQSELINTKKLDSIGSNILYSVKPLSQKKKELARLQCYECGTELSSDDKYCPNCGDDTKQELADYNKESY